MKATTIQQSREQIRPYLDPSVGREFREFCTQHGFKMNVVATQAIARWMKETREAIGPQ